MDTCTPHDCSGIEARLRALLPASPQIEFVVARIADHRAALLPEELPAIGRAIDKRVHEFSTGRVAARRAMGGLGLPAAPIPRDGSRAPVWPHTCAGSITHGGDLAMAAVARRDALRGLGIDLEEADRVTEELFDKLLTVAERQRLQASTASVGGARRRAGLVFSAKEAVYKAVNPIVGVFIGFKEVEVDFEPHAHAETGRFTLRYIGEHAPNRVMEAGEGYYCFFEQYVFTAFVIP